MELISVKSSDKMCVMTIEQAEKKHSKRKKTGRYKTAKQGRKKRNDFKAITDDQLSQVEVMAGLGLNGKDIAHVLGMSRESLVRRQRENPAIYDALCKGRAIAKFKVHATAYQMATSGNCHPMTKFWLQARSGWKEAQEIQFNFMQTNFGHQDIGRLSDSQLLELTDKCMTALKLASKDQDLIEGDIVGEAAAS